MLFRTLALGLLVAGTHASDNLDLRLDRGAGGSVDLSWSGAIGEVEIHRDTNPQQLFRESNRIAASTNGTLNDSPPSALIQFYRLRDCLTPGALIVSEVMANPDGVSDSVGEWIEVENRSAVTFLLNGWQVSDNGATHTINSTDPLTIAPGQLFLLARESDPALNCFLTPDYVYDGFNLNNNGDAVILSRCSVEIDRLDFTDTTAGSSIFIDGTGQQCEDDFLDYGCGDTGSPGAVNSPCF